MGKKKSEKSKTPFAVVEMRLCDMLAGRPAPELLDVAEAFPHQFLIVRPEAGGAPIILKVIDNVATIISEEYAAGYLREYVTTFKSSLPEMNITYAACLRVIKSWSHQAIDLRVLPQAVVFKSNPSLCMTRLSFDPIPTDLDALEVHAPFFSEMLSRMNNMEAFCMRLGSLFDPEADRKQAVWLYGPADCGKSEFAWLLMELTGKSYGLLSNADLETPFWKAQLVGKRVGIVNEAAAKFIRSDEFKAITGDDMHSINQKGEPIFYANLETMMFFFSNHAPDIPNDEALMTRIIDCLIKPIPAGKMLTKTEIRNSLGKELPYIAGYCIALYSGVANGKRISKDTSELTKTVEKFEADYLDFLEHHFVKDENGLIHRSDFKGLMLDWGFKTPMEMGICKRVLLSNFGAIEDRETFKTNVDIGAAKDKRLFVYKGIRLRKDNERQFKAKEDGSAMDWQRSGNWSGNKT